jgi:DNA-binding transcriptional LysR family regulator
LREGASGDLQQAVADGRLDVAVVSWSDQPAAGLTGWVALVEQVTVVVAPDHPWADRGTVAPGDLLGQPIIVTTIGTGMRAAYESLMRREGLVAPVQWEVTLPTTVRTMAARGFGIGVVTSSVADPPADVRRIEIASPYTRSSLGVVWRSQPNPSPAAQAVLSAFRRHLGGASGGSHNTRGR